MKQPGGPLLRKSNRLREILAGMGKVLVAYSGGVDSTLLLKTAKDVLGNKVLAVIAASKTYPKREVREAKMRARSLGVRTQVIHSRELDDPRFRANPPERCYFCKRELFSSLRKIAAEAGIPYVLDGSNLDDRSDFRPGSKAGRELGVRSPLQEAGLTKAEIRRLSRALGLPTWDKPSLACLASRFPYYAPIEDKALDRVGRAEELLRKLGFRQLRVRDHGLLARIEVEPAAIPRMAGKGVREKVARSLRKLGYEYVSLDLEGYRTGSLNAPLRRGLRRRG